MAVTFAGSAVSGPIDAKNNDIAFAIENSAFSRVAVQVLRVVSQMDNLTLITGAGGYIPLLKTYKVTGVASGGVVLPKRKFDTLLSSDAGVVVRQAVPSSDPVLEVAVTGSPELDWQQFTSRKTSAAEQHMTWDFSQLPTLVDTSPYWILYPGEVMFVRVIQGSLTGTAAAGGTLFVEAVWQEDDSYDAGYMISGDVTLDAVPVVGAKVFVLTDLTVDMTNPQVEVKTTGAGGAWSKLLASGVKAAAFVQHKVGVDRYTDEGKPYLEKP